MLIVPQILAQDRCTSLCNEVIAMMSEKVLTVEKAEALLRKLQLLEKRPPGAPAVGPCPRVRFVVVVRPLWRHHRCVNAVLEPVEWVVWQCGGVEWCRENVVHRAP